MPAKIPPLGAVDVTHIDRIQSEKIGVMRECIDIRAGNEHTDVGSHRYTC